MENMWQTVVTILGSIFVAALTFAWWLRGRFDHIDKKLERIYVVVSSSLNGLRKLLSEWNPKLVGILKKSSLLDDDTYHELMTPTILNEILEALAKGESGNPISTEERATLRRYLEKLKRGEILNQDEAREFYELSERVSRETTEPWVWSLLIIAAFALGWWFGGSRDGQQQK
jgi:hypothetical protein